MIKAFVFSQVYMQESNLYESQSLEIPPMQSL